MMKSDKKTARRRRNAGTPAYLMLLKKHGLVNPREIDGFHLWMRLCESPEVVKRAKKYAARQRPEYVSGFGIGYSFCEKVLNAMKPSELAELKLSLGIKPEKEFAVL
jgi:hypothetical protein